MQVYIETPRLIIRPIEEGDAPGMFAMDSDPEVHKYLGNTPYTDMSQTLENIRFIREQYVQNGIGRWAMLLRDTGEFVGWTGFKLMRTPLNGHIDFHDFGYRMAKKHWGKGLATEGSRAALNYGINQLGYKEIFGTALIDNTASRNVLEKLGFRYVNDFIYDNPSWPGAFGLPVTWYELQL